MSLSPALHPFRVFQPAKVRTIFWLTEPLGLGSGLASSPGNWWRNTLNPNELGESRITNFLDYTSSAERQFLPQVTNPQAFVNAS
jgi:hypothetical protein